MPAFLLAGFVGYSRVKSLNHFADDVLAGASIDISLTNFIQKNNLEIGVAATNELKAIVVKAPIEETHKTHNKIASIWNSNRPYVHAKHFIE